MKDVHALGLTRTCCHGRPCYRRGPRCRGQPCCRRSHCCRRCPCCRGHPCSRRGPCCRGHPCYRRGPCCHGRPCCQRGPGCRGRPCCRRWPCCRGRPCWRGRHWEHTPGRGRCAPPVLRFRASTAWFSPVHSSTGLRTVVSPGPNLFLPTVTSS